MMEKWAREENKNISSCSILLISVSVGGSDLSQNGSLKSTNREEVQPKKYSPHHKSIRWKKKAHKPSSQREEASWWSKEESSRRTARTAPEVGRMRLLLIISRWIDRTELVGPASHPPRSPPMKNGRPIKFIPSPSPLRVWDARSKVICFNWIFDWLALHRTRPKWSAKWRVAHNKGLSFAWMKCADCIAV